MFNIINVLRKLRIKSLYCNEFFTLEILGIFSGVIESLHTPPSSLNDYGGANDDNACDEDMRVCRSFLRVCTACVSV